MSSLIIKKIVKSFKLDPAKSTDKDKIIQDKLGKKKQREA